MSFRRGGVGMYPDETCFDPSRPAWLPYWIDDVTEIQCDANEMLWGNTTGNTAQPDQQGVAPQTLANAQAACQAQAGTWNADSQTCTPNPLAPILSNLPWVAAIVVGLVLLKK